MTTALARSQHTTDITDATDTNTDTDSALLRKHLNGDPLALSELLERHELRLRWCLRNLGISEYDMADVWQEATLRIHR